MALSTEAALRKDRLGKSSMEHRHFATVAAIIHAIEDEGERQRMAEHFADELRSTNPRFDRKRFIAACLEA